MTVNNAALIEGVFFSSFFSGSSMFIAFLAGSMRDFPSILKSNCKKNYVVAFLFYLVHCIELNFIALSSKTDKIKNGGLNEQFLATKVFFLNIS